MRCKTCDYPLWNLKTRNCPECGAPFLPSEHEFVPNSVRFCCPDCEQAYYGTSLKGHLVPEEFDCVQCGTHLHMDALVLRPSEGVRETDTLADRMPWIRRRDMSWFRAWRTTVGRAMITPLRLMRSVPVESGTGSAWWFAGATMAIVLFIGGGVPLAVIGLIDLLAGGNSAFEILMSGLFGTMIGALAFLLLIVIWGLVAHGLLRVTGGATHGIGRTYQCLCYSAGANVTSAIPCLGLYPLIFIGLTWWAVSAVLMTTEGQRTDGGRAAFAVLTFPILAAAGVVAMVFGAMFWGVSQAQVAISAAVSAQLQAETQPVLDAVIDHAALHGGVGPGHALELLVFDDAPARTGANVPGLDTWSYVANDTMTAPGDIPLGDRTLAAIAGAPPEERTRLIAAAAAALPVDVIAHRVGDFVFTCHGIDPAGADGELWLVVLAADPDMNAGVFTSMYMTVGKADGTTEAITADTFGAALDDQNERRAAQGLAPIPPPEVVRHGAPAAENVETRD